MDSSSEPCVFAYCYRDGARSEVAHVSTEKEIQFRHAARGASADSNWIREKISQRRPRRNESRPFVAAIFTLLGEQIPWNKSCGSKEFFLRSFRPIGTGSLSLSLSRSNVFFSNKEVFVLVCTERLERSSMTFRDPPEKNILKFIYPRKFT